MTAGRAVERVSSRRLATLTQSSGRRRDQQRVGVHLVHIGVVEDFIEVVEEFVDAGVVERRHGRRRKCSLVAGQRQVGVQTVVSTRTCSGRDVISRRIASWRTCRDVTDLRDVTSVLRQHGTEGRRKETGSGRGVISGSDVRGVAATNEERVGAGIQVQGGISSDCGDGVVGLECSRVDLQRTGDHVGSTLREAASQSSGEGEAVGSSASLEYIGQRCDVVARQS